MSKRIEKWMQRRGWPDMANYAPRKARPPSPWKRLAGHFYFLLMIGTLLLAIYRMARLIVGEFSQP